MKRSGTSDKKSTTNVRTVDEPAAVWVDIGDLKAWEHNPRKNDDNVARVAESIKRFGFSAPIVARKQDGEVIAGHTRLKAALLLGIGKVPVRYMDLDPADAHLLALADNRLNELAPWDEPALHGLLSEYGLEGAALAGWSEVDLEKMATDLLKASSRDVVEDAVPEPPEKPITNLGDVWQLGSHRLVCGDATDAAVFAAALNGARPGLMVTDPPYGVDVAGGTHDPRDPNYRKGAERKVLANDKLTGEKLETFLRQAFALASTHLANGAAWYVWYADTQSKAFINAAEALGGFKHILVWVKPNFVFGRSDYHYRHEPVLYGWTAGAAHSWLGRRTQSSVFEEARDDAVAELKHPTVKPVKLYATPIGNHVGADGSILDCFAGSGPAFSAAEQTGRRCYGIELDPRFCDVIVERWQNLTGGKAIRHVP